MHLQKYFLLASMVATPLLAVSDHATAVLNKLSTVSKTLEVNKDSIDEYNGGLTSAGLVGQKNYDTWSALLSANRELGAEDDELSDDDADAIIKKVTALNDDAVRLMDVYKQKEPLFRRAAVNFLVPVSLEALYHESDSMMIKLEDRAPKSFQQSIQATRAKFIPAWESVFEEYAANLDSDSGSKGDYQRFFSVVKPVLRLLP